MAEGHHRNVHDDPGLLIGSNVIRWPPGGMASCMAIMTLVIRDHHETPILPAAA
jgi:hypothetical protein